jgi:hypothetical protein
MSMGWPADGAVRLGPVAELKPLRLTNFGVALSRQQRPQSHPAHFDCLP